MFSTVLAFPAVFPYRIVSDTQDYKGRKKGVNSSGLVSSTVWRHALGTGYKLESEPVYEESGHFLFPPVIPETAEGAREGVLNEWE